VSANESMCRHCIASVSVRRECVKSASKMRSCVTKNMKVTIPGGIVVVARKVTIPRGIVVMRKLRFRVGIDGKRLRIHSFTLSSNREIRRLKH
jgi:hypothetical protein